MGGVQEGGGVHGAFSLAVSEENCVPSQAGGKISSSEVLTWPWDSPLLSFLFHPSPPPTCSQLPTQLSPADPSIFVATARCEGAGFDVMCQRAMLSK